MKTMFSAKVKGTVKGETLTVVEAASRRLAKSTGISANLPRAPRRGSKIMRALRPPPESPAGLSP